MCSNLSNVLSSNVRALFNMSSANVYNMDEAKILSCGKTSTLFQTTTILALSKVKAFAGDNLNGTQNMEMVFHRVENIVGKGKNAGSQHFILFPKWFLKTFFSGALNVIIVWQKVLTLSQTSPGVCRTSLLKTLWEKEKLFVTSNFSFSHSVFYPFGEPSAIFINLKLSSANSFG